MHNVPVIRLYQDCDSIYIEWCETDIYILYSRETDIEYILHMYIPNIYTQYTRPLFFFFFSFFFLAGLYNNFLFHISSREVAHQQMRDQFKDTYAYV